MATTQARYLQELFILATGKIANTPNFDAVQALVGANNNYATVDSVINNYLNAQEASLGKTVLIQTIARNALGLTITETQANNAAADLTAAGLNTWAKVLHWLADNTTSLTTTLNNRADTAVYFTDQLAADGKTSIFTGALITTAASNLLQGVGATATSITNTQAAMDELADNFSANGLAGTVLDGYVADAMVYLDTNNNGFRDSGEVASITNSNGKYIFSNDIAISAVDANYAGYRAAPAAGASCARHTPGCTGPANRSRGTAPSVSSNPNHAPPRVAADPSAGSCASVRG